MKRKLPLINMLLILILFLLLGWGGYSWWQPEFSSTVERDGIVPAQRELIALTLARLPYSKAIAREVTRLNIFRKQRKKYYRAKPPKPKPRPKVTAPSPKVAMIPSPPPKPVAPPPKLILTGVVLMGGKKVAIFEGTYSDIRGGKLIQNLKPRRRGYQIGESLGGYRIEAIQKTHVTLSATQGKQLILKVSKSTAFKKIQKTGTLFTQKSKTGVIKNTRPPTSLKTRKSKPSPLQFNPLKGAPRPSEMPSFLSGPGSKGQMTGPSQPGPSSPLRQSPAGF